MCVQWVFIFSAHAPKHFWPNSMGKKINQCLPSIIGANGTLKRFGNVIWCRLVLFLVAFNGHLLKIIYLRLQTSSRKMKVLGIDDNSEAFSLLLTAIAGVLLFAFTYFLNKRVMGNKTEVSVASACARLNK